jgi:hypothetical protein
MILLGISSKLEAEQKAAAVAGRFGIAHWLIPGKSG